MRWGGLGLAVAALACAGCAGAGESSPAGAAQPATQLEPAAAAAEPATPDTQAAAKKPKRVVPAPPAHGPAYLVARIRRPLRTPFGTVPDRTLYAQPVWAPVVRHHGDRGRLLVPLGKRGRVVSADLRKVQLQWREVRVVVDLSAERMVVRDGRQRLGVFPIGNGAPSTPTPTGRFFVTDRLEFGQGSPYAPFAFGLSAHVSQLPASWLGGDQVAIHYGAMGAVSHGCIHAGLDAIELLKRRAALGTLVIVKA
ncbi:MAG TPA: L,D-transpeptidase [Gaiellales bacterium]|nr:L,D-transpeptidase [Gaiellales bacterium]